MENGIGTVFLSHSSHEPDYSVTRTLAEALKEVGIDVWWDVEKLEGGAFFPVEILEAIIRQHFLSSSYLNNRWNRNGANANL